MIRDVKIQDVFKILEIYNYYILNTSVTFEEDPVSSIDMEKRILEITEHYPWLVYENEGVVVGYAYASAWRVRKAYRHSVETTVYLQHGLSGKGIGTKLYSELLSRLSSQNLHGLIGGIALPNPASIRLHEKLGFEKVAHFKEVGFKFNKWIDVTYWEKII